MLQHKKSSKNVHKVAGHHVSVFFNLFFLPPAILLKSKEDVVAPEIVAVAVFATVTMTHDTTVSRHLWVTMRNRTVTAKIRRNICVTLLLKRFQIPGYWLSTPSIWLSKPSFPLLSTYPTVWISSYVCPLLLALDRVSVVTLLHTHTDTTWIYTLIYVSSYYYMCVLLYLSPWIVF